MDLADRLASKATTDPVIESMLNEHPDPFDSYRLDRDEQREVLTVLPPMNLGTGPLSAAMSKSNSAAEALVKGARQNDEAATTKLPTPRQLAKAPVSVSDVLGLNGPDDDHYSAPQRSEQAQTAPTQDDAASSRSSPSSPLHSRRASQDPPQAPAPATSSSAASSPGLIATDSSALPTSSSMATANPFDAPSLTTESAPFLTSLASSSSSAATAVSGSKPPVTSPRKHGRRRLSRVSEANDPPPDPMAGDWSAPVFGRSLSPGMNGGSGYDSGEVRDLSQ